MSLEFIQANSQGFLIGTGIVLAIGVLWLLMLKFGFREKSFEEVVEEQRKRMTQEELMSKQEKVKKDKEKEKKHKKWGKRKEKTEQPTDSKTSSEQSPSVPETASVPSDTGDEIEVIEPKEVAPKKKQQKQPQQKPTVASNSVSSAATTSSVSMPAPAKSPDAPKKATESSKAAEKNEKVESNVTKDKEKPKVEVKAVVAEPLQASKPVEPEVASVSPAQVASPPLQQQASNAASKKKKKVDQADKTDVSRVTASSLISMVKEAALGDLESQMLIEVLLNKQKEAGGWKKPAGKDSQAQALKKQQHDKEILEQDQKANQIKSKQDLAQEKGKASSMEKLLQEKIALLQQEVQGYASRLKQAQELQISEKAAFQEKISGIEKDADAKLKSFTKKFEEEKAHFMKTIKKLESESKSSQSLAELETIKKSRDDLQKVHTLLVEQHTQMIACHKTEVKTLNAQIADAKKLLQESQNKNAALQKEMESLKKKQGDLSTVKKTADDHKKKIEESEAAVKRMQVLLDEAERRAQDSNGKLEIELNRVTELTKENGKLTAEIEVLQTEIERLSAELAVSNERVAGDGQEMLQQNGEVDVKKELEQQIADEKEKILQEKEQRLSQLYDDLNTCKVKITSLSEELEQQKLKNNELREKNWKAVEALAAAEQKASDAEDRIKEVQEIQQKLKQLQEIQENSSSTTDEISQRLSDSEKHRQKLQAELYDSLEKYKLEVEKNSNLTAELKEIQLQRESLEKRLSDSQQAVEELRSEVNRTHHGYRSCLQKLFPAVTLDSTLPHDEWLMQFEQQARNALNAASGSREEVEKLLARLSEAGEESSALKNKISHYEEVLAETEAMLNKLQDSAKIKESEWEEKLHQAELEMKKVTDELETVKAEKEKLSSLSAELGRIDELDVEVKSLRQRLEAAENEKLSFQQKYDEVNKNYINVKDQIDSKTKLVEDLQKEVTSFDRVKKELEDVKSKLEKEKKISKDFSAQMVRLNSLVKIGQDSLNAEQETVKKLQNQLSQLQAAQVATANGTSSPPAMQVSESPAKSVKNEKLKKSKKSDASGKK